METENSLQTLPPKFSVSAPGKVILHGEHSVVYGHHAIAASLNLRTKVSYDLLDAPNFNQQFLHIIFRNVDVDVKLSAREIDDLLSVTCKSSWDFSSPQNIEFEKTVEHVQNFITSHPSLKALKDFQQLSIKTALFLMVAILNHPNTSKLPALKPFSLRVTSELPVGAGAGSSASYCVSLATLFICLASFRAEPNKAVCLDEKTKELISSWAFIGERITHGNPSGLDNSICTFGALLSFRRPNTIVKIPLHKGVRVLLVDTKVSRNTRTLIDRAAKLREHHRVIVDTIMQAMDSISLEAEKFFPRLDAAKRSGSKEETAELLKRMGELWSMNHSLLQALGVSHPSLERIVEISRNHGLCGKLTGAGGGGFAIVLVPVHFDTNNLKKSLTDCHFDVKDVELGGPGVQLHHQ